MLTIMSTKNNTVIGLNKTIWLLIAAGNNCLDTESIFWKKPDNTRHLVDVFGLSYGDGWTNNRLSWDPVHGWTDGDRNENHDLLDSRSLSLKKADWRIKLVNGSIHYIKMTSIKAKNADGMITISFCTDTEDGAHEFLLKLKK